MEVLAGQGWSAGFKATSTGLRLKASAVNPEFLRETDWYLAMDEESKREVNDAAVEKDYGYLKGFIGAAWNSPLTEVEALVERIRIDLMLETVMTRARKALYREAIDYLESVLDRRYEKLEVPRPSRRHAVLNYVKRMLDAAD